jgi:hypothetical protein
MVTITFIKASSEPDAALIQKKYKQLKNIIIFMTPSPSIREIWIQALSSAQIISEKKEISLRWSS